MELEYFEEFTAVVATGSSGTVGQEPTDSSSVPPACLIIQIKVFDSKSSCSGFPDLRS